MIFTTALIVPITVFLFIIVLSTYLGGMGIDSAVETRKQQ
jgi:hypothetical protein